MPAYASNRGRIRNVNSTNAKFKRCCSAKHGSCNNNHVRNHCASREHKRITSQRTELDVSLLRNNSCAHVLNRANGRAGGVLVRAKQPRAKVGSETHNKVLKSKLAVS
jgi:hypothetical protein